MSRNEEAHPYPSIVPEAVAYCTLPDRADEQKGEELCRLLSHPLKIRRRISPK